MISTIPGADICHDGFGSLALDYASKEGPRCKAAKKAAAGPLPSMGDEVKTMELRIREEDTMTRKWVAFASALLLSGTVAVAADWNSSFSTVDTDGNGSINRAEFTANEGKLDPTMNPTFTMMDKDGSNSVDQDEWSAAAKQKMAIAKGCTSSDKSWCPCQNNPDDPECQK